MLLCKGVAGTGFEIFFKGVSFMIVSKSDGNNNLPGFEFVSMR